MSQKNYKFWIPVFEGDEDTAIVSDLEGQLSKITDTNSPEYKRTHRLLSATKLSLDVKAGKFLPQDRVNTLLAEDKRKHQDAHRKTLEELEALQKRSNLSKEEREDLERRIEETQKTLRTEKETAEQERQKILKNHKKDLDTITGERDSWKKHYTDEKIENSILGAAAGSNPKIVNPEQILIFLRPNTRLVEELGEDGKPTGKYAAKVTFKDKDKNGKPITLELFPSEAIKRMSEMEEHFNLFASDGNSGFGKFRVNKGKELNLRDLAKDPAAYRKARKEGIIR
jgi:hypothetical protein